MADSASDPLDTRSLVLLVEDTLEDALLIRSLLEAEMGCKVTLAQDGIRGCQLAGAQEWDLVVTDLNLPGRDGIEVIETSKQSFPATPVLATTAYTQGEYHEQATRSGADELLGKPLDKDDLLARVGALIRRRQAPGSERARDEPPTRSVLAIGALPGDVELGCGGILLGHRAHHHRVGILVLSAGGAEGDVAERRRESEEAAAVMDAELILADPFREEIPPVERMIEWVAEAVDRFDPDTLYTPSRNDVRDSRLRTYQAGIVEGADAPNHYCYQAATTTLEFHPSLFIDVAEYMKGKLDALARYRGEPNFRPHLQPQLARSTALYWGRFLGYRTAEPLEVVRSEV